MRFADFIKKDACNMNKFSIDFNLDTDKNKYYTKLQDTLSEKGIFLHSTIGSKYFFIAPLNIDKVINIIKSINEFNDTDKFIITDYTNNIVKQIGIDDSDVVAFILSLEN